MEMMSNNNNKNNLNKAMFDMFGVGKAPEQEKKEYLPQQFHYTDDRQLA